jgi:apolipoprotein N-acyltransferase
MLSEYTFDGPIPENIRAWCRDHQRYLVAGGKEPLGTTNFYNTAFVVGPDGDIIHRQVKSVPIQFFKDGLPAPKREVWQSPWGPLGILICYDLSYTRVVDDFVRQGARALLAPTMDVADWGRHQHELHARVAPLRAAEYGIPIFRVCSSGISQLVNDQGAIFTSASFPGEGAMLGGRLPMDAQPHLPLDRFLASTCTVATALLCAWLAFDAFRHRRSRSNSVAADIATA